jgi:hypothetical protein
VPLCWSAKEQSEGVVGPRAHPSPPRSGNRAGSRPSTATTDLFRKNRKTLKNGMRCLKFLMMMMMMIYYQKTGIKYNTKKDEAPLRNHSISLITQAFTPQPRNLARIREMSSQYGG